MTAQLREDEARGGSRQQFDKRILGLRRLRLRGPCGANDKFLLAAAAQNFRKLAKIFPAPQKPRAA